MWFREKINKYRKEKALEECNISNIPNKTIDVLIKVNVKNINDLKKYMV